MELSQDQARDVHETIEFFVALADQDADFVGAFLKGAGFEPGTTFPQQALLKIAALSRLLYWEDLGLPHVIEDDLPTSSDVFEDLIDELSGEPPRFETVALCQRVHLCAFRRFSWPQLQGQSGFMLKDASEPSELLDVVAELLWEFRDLKNSAR